MVIKIINMERVIKFRGQNIKGDWNYGLLCHDKNKDTDYEWFISNSVGKPYAFGAIQKSIGQFTGLKDKNGVEIYEGDIVRILYTDWTSKPESDHRTLQQYLNDISYIAKVVFERNSWRVSIYGKKYQEWYLDDIIPGQHGFIEVIGNIHENPDLLDPR